MKSLAFKPSKLLMTSWLCLLPWSFLLMKGRMSLWAGQWSWCNPRSSGSHQLVAFLIWVKKLKDELGIGMINSLPSFLHAGLKAPWKILVPFPRGPPGCEQLCDSSLDWISLLLGFCSCPSLCSFKSFPKEQLVPKPLHRSLLKASIRLRPVGANSFSEPLCEPREDSIGRWQRSWDCPCGACDSGHGSLTEKAWGLTCTNNIILD